MRNYAELLTRWRQAEINAMFDRIANGEMEMRAFKHKLAGEIVSIFHGDEAATQAAAHARRMFEGEAPSDSPTVLLPAGTHKPIIDLLYKAEIVKSKGEGRRLIQQGSARVDGETVTDIEQLITAASDDAHMIQVGKRKFLRIVVQQ